MYKRESIKYIIKRKVIERDGHICRYCGKDCMEGNSGGYHFDHVYPVSKGGETSIDNIVIACVKCNIRKGARVGLWPKPIGYFGEVKKISLADNVDIPEEQSLDSIHETELKWAREDIKELESRIFMLENKLAIEKSKVYDYEHKIYNYKELQEKAKKDKQASLDNHRKQLDKTENHYNIQMFAMSFVALILMIGFFILYTGL